MSHAAFRESPLNKVSRLQGRAKYDYETIHGLVDTCPILHVSFGDAEHVFPITLPMLGCMWSFSGGEGEDGEQGKHLYVHGYVGGRLFRHGKGNGDGVEQGVPVCVSATFLDGLVLSLTPFHNSCNYRSAVVFGYAELVTDEEEKMGALKAITENLLPGRWDMSRSPPTQAELNSTGVLKVRIQSASAKIRTGGPSEDRADLKNQELVGKTWTGVVPYWGTWGEPVEGKENRCQDVEGYIEEWRVRETGKAREYAFEAIDMDEKKKK